MNVIDRFTRDDVSAKVWWPLAMVLVVLFIVTFPASGRQRDAVHEDATDLGVAIVQDIVDPAVVQVTGGEAPAEAQAEELAEVLQDDVLQEFPPASQVRLWAADSTLLFSTDPADQIGSAAAVNDGVISRATDAPTRPVAFPSEENLTGGQAPPRFEVYQALASTPRLVAQVEFDDDMLLAGVDATWLAWQIALGVAGALTFALAALSMREPLARSGYGVPFYPTSVPAGSAVIDADDAAALRQAGAHARRRVQEMQDRMEGLEVEKIRLEGELQRALSGRAMGGAAPFVEPGAVAPVPRARPQRREPLIVVPDPEVEEDRGVPTDEAVLPDLPEPAPDLEPVRAAEPAPELEPVPEPVRAAEPEPEPEPAPAPEPEPEPEPVRAAEPAPEPEPEPARAAEPTWESAPPVTPSSRKSRSRRPAATDRWAASTEEVVRVPDAGSDSDEDVLSVLERLVEPVGTGARSPDVASDMRARLARTAARKKPGSRADDRFEHPDQ